MPFDLFFGLWGDGDAASLPLTGDLPTITVSAPSGTLSALSGLTLSGNLPTITVSAPDGVLATLSNVVITGNLPTITMSAPDGSLSAFFDITPAPADVVRSRASAIVKGSNA